ncbi:Protein of unknown function D [Prunus dulcis]|uniref:Uncharacterized protein n=1 Tax=Prunus dulcis TaxID=3755 RepID=A0A5H2XY13_PRUDU|nr:Protein of unknown function D [Prunus dulcis]
MGSGMGAGMESGDGMVLSYPAPTRPVAIPTFGLLRPHIHASTTATTRRHLGRHRFRWNHHTLYFPFHPPPPRSATVVAGISHERQRFGKIFTKLSTLRSLSFLHQFGRVRYSTTIRSRRDPLRVRQCGTTWEILPKFLVESLDS